MASKPIPSAGEIPVTFMASLKSWLQTSVKESEVAEQRLLKRLPTFRMPNEADVTTPASSNARISQVQLSGKSRYINMLSILPTTPAQHSLAPAPQSQTASVASAANQNGNGSEPPPTTVILHGYGAGLGFFTLNLDSLSKWVSTRGLPVYICDWLGMGRSSRTPFKVTAKQTDARGRVEQAETFFVSSLEEWRQKMGINKMTLVGHSLGGYLVTAYALKHPQHVSRLVLLSPAGVPRGPDTAAAEDDLNELTRSRSKPDQVEANAPPKEIPNPKASDVATIKKEQIEDKQEKKNESLGRRLFIHAWEAGYSPFGLLRLGGPWAPLLVGKYTTRRFEGLDESHLRDLHQYLLQISLLRGSGEYALNHILAPMAYARVPLEHRITQLDKNIPVTYVYGSHDWMDPEGGVRSVQRLKKAGNNESKLVIVPGAGHHVYLDNPDVVNKLLIKEMDKATGGNRMTIRMR